jgi:L-alanine-DL-glutamate epimerase-like enolase superfamily enzyme
MAASSPTEIVEIFAYRLRIKLKKPFITSLGANTHAENILIRMVTADGTEGQGECSPFPSINGESMETAYVVADYLGAALKGSDALDIASSIEKMNRAIYANSSIKSAFDMALYDIAAKNSGMPLWRFLGGKKDKTIATDYTVSLDTPEHMAVQAAQIKEEGFPLIKVKLGDNPLTDISRVREIRKAVGPDIPLRLDANQGWNPSGTILVLSALADMNIQHCEEPIPRWQFMDLPELKRNSPLPLMADESCCDEHDAERLIRLDACHRFNIKLGKSGGLFTAQRMLRIAEKHGIPVQLGGFLESRLAFTAATHLAFCSPQVLYYDFDTCLMFEYDPVQDGIRYLKNGIIELSDLPGIGAHVDGEYLRTLPHKKL